MARPLLQEPSPLDLPAGLSCTLHHRAPSSQPSPLALDLIPSRPKAKGSTPEPVSPSAQYLDPLGQIVHQHKRAPV